MIGMPAKDAVAALESLGLYVEIAGEGESAIGQVPAPSTRIAEGDSVLVRTV